MTTAVTVADSGSMDFGSLSGIGDIPVQFMSFFTDMFTDVFGSSDLQDNWDLIVHTLIKILGAVIALHP